MSALLEVLDLVVRIPLEGGGYVRAVSGVSFSIAQGESMALVGESGCGKSVTVLSILGLLPSSAWTTRGVARFAGRDLLALTSRDLRSIRGREIGIVFQDPSASLNPVLTIGAQLTEGLRAHRRMDARACEERAAELLALVGIPDARRRLTGYPHEFSGGQRQRILIAMAIANEPSLLIADEATTALDATVQAQIVELLASLRRSLGMATLWITHDLALVGGLVDRVAVMYAGEIVERAKARELFKHPRHPYTAGLLGAMPQGFGRQDRRERLMAIPGLPPDLRSGVAGCAFAPRCAMAEAACSMARPPLKPVGPDHESACFRSGEM